MPRPCRDPERLEIMRWLYNEKGLSLEEIGIVYRISTQAVHQLFKANDIPRRSKGAGRGKRHLKHDFNIKNKLYASR